MVILLVFVQIQTKLQTHFSLLFGFNRGRVRNAIKLSYNPIMQREIVLYRARVNPVVNFSGQGVTLFGDKTALTKPSAFDRINVRRLFLFLRKGNRNCMPKFQLFEFNDEFTRAQFRNLVEPFLRDIQGRRGIQILVLLQIQQIIQVKL